MRRAYSIPASALRSLSEWASVLATSSGLGFDTLILALPGGNVFGDRVSADLELAKLVALASDRSLQIILDVPDFFRARGKSGGSNARPFREQDGGARSEGPARRKAEPADPVFR